MDACDLRKYCGGSMIRLSCIMQGNIKKEQMIDGVYKGTFGIYPNNDYYICAWY